MDFETADQGRDSACAIGLVRVEGSTVVAREHRLIRPPRRDFVFTYVHGISWPQVSGEPTFGTVWRQVRWLLDGADFVAAHSAAFDRSVLHACCAVARLKAPRLEFVCTMKLARVVWGVRPTRLPDVCRHLGLTLSHHDAASDAEACAGIVTAALRHEMSPADLMRAAGSPRARVKPTGRRART
ncbi:MAG: 3'-5' exonuclease [Deltaproteobacteria bacterium]|nr:3'-5' exonuclease [Deltaproteobacteria bacterium]